MFARSLCLFGTIAISIATTATRRENGIRVTPHDKYSSSIGVLGCKVNTNRIAYWPLFPDCDHICVRVDSNGRSINLLRIDQSGGYYDISYDAWNYLATGMSATQSPATGGGIDATYENVDMSECAELLIEPAGRLAFSATNSMNFVTSCPADSWVGQHTALYNIANPACTYGYDEECAMPDLAVTNQPSCSHTPGSLDSLTTCPVYNIDYRTGEESLAT